MSFAHWQKFTWETEDPPIGMLIAGSVDGRTLSPEETAAYDAPFPDPSYKMGPRAMPSQVPTLSDDPSVAANLRAWGSSRSGKSLCCALSATTTPSREGAPARSVRACRAHRVNRTPPSKAVATFFRKAGATCSQSSS